MLKKYSASNILLAISFFGSILSLTLFSFLKIPFLFTSLQTSSQSSFIIMILGLITSLSFFSYLIIKKEINSPDTAWSKFLFLILPLMMIFSTIFSPSFTNSFFGKVISTSNLVFYSSLILFVYIISAYLKKGYKSITWLTIMGSSLLLTIPVALAIILLRLNLQTASSYMVYFVSNWDVVALVSALIIVISLVYFETIAFSARQRFISLALILIHLILVFFIIIPDIWYALSLSSLAVLAISCLHKKTDKKKFYNRLSFYVFVISLFFSLTFALANFWGKATTFAQNISAFSSKYSGINYTFVKPQFNLSFNLSVTRIKKGQVFGAGLNEFNNVWQKEKPQTILESMFWNTEFTSSYSAFTTFLVTIGILGVLAILFIIAVLIKGVYKDVRKKDGTSHLDLDDENRFYFLSSVALFIFSIALFFLFVNTQLTIIIFALAIALLSAHIIKWKEASVAESTYLLFFILLIVILSGSIININRLRAANIEKNALSNFQNQKNKDYDSLENSLLKSARISNDDTDYRLLSQFYLYKTQQLLSASSTDTQDLQNKVLKSLNDAITSSKVAISLDPNDYNNYLTLGSVYGFSMNLDKQNKDAYYKNANDAYNQALVLYPKNPSIPLTIAELQYSYNKNSTSTIDRIKKSLEIKPNYSAAYYILSQLAAQNNDRKSAMDYASLAIQADSTNVDAYMQYGILAISSKTPSKDDISNALLAFSTVFRNDQSNVTAAYYLSITLALAKDFTDAKALADSLSKALPNEQKIKDLQTFIDTQAKSAPKSNTQPQTAGSTKQSVK